MAGGITVEDQHAKGRADAPRRWLFRVYDPVTGRRKSRAFARKAEGWEWARAQRAMVDDGWTIAGQVALADVARAYCAQLRAQGRAPGHVDDIERVLLLVAEVAPDMRADAWRDQVWQWLQDARAAHDRAPAAATRNKWRMYARAVSAWAYRRRLLPHDPLLDLPRFAVPEKAKATLGIEQARRLVSDDLAHHPWWLPHCLLQYAGCRILEAMHLRWEWIDWDARIVQVRLHPAYRIKRAKERFVPLQGELAAILAPRRQAQGWIVADDRLRGGSNKTRWCGWREYVAQAGYSPAGLSPHSVRHTWIAMMLATGASPTSVRRWAGHASLQTTDGYADAEASYLHAVSGWPRGQLCLRRPPPSP